jgi:hypothetical protein
MFSTGIDTSLESHEPLPKNLNYYRPIDPHKNSADGIKKFMPCLKRLTAQFFFDVTKWPKSDGVILGEEAE